MGSKKPVEVERDDDTVSCYEGKPESLPFALVMVRKRPEPEVTPDLREPGAAALASPLRQTTTPVPS